MPEAAYTLGVDVGGTFTDYVATRSGEHGFFKGKVPTRPHDEATSVLEAIRSVADHFSEDPKAVLQRMQTIVLGTTVVTNTMLEYNGAKTGLICTKGFRDTLELRRGYRESLFDLALPPPPALVPRRWRLGVTERIDSDGAVETALDEQEVREVVRSLKSDGVESIAVCLLFSFLNPAHERRIREIVVEEHPDCFVCLSCEVLPQIREFERLSTTVVNAYTSPKLRNYLSRLKSRLVAEGFAGALHVMQSNGGVMDVEYTADHGVDAVLSGPSGGVVASLRLGEQSGYRNLITADMGGTSYDVCLIHDAKPEVGVDQWISRYRIAVPLLDIHTIGAGGGSIGWVDSGGALRVGPQSAGAYPGPACYGRGGELPTVTDANLVLGYMDPARFLGGKMSLDRGNAEKALETHLAKPLGISVEDAAVGIARIANNAMSNALRYVSVSRGRDPRDYALMAFGGAGAISAGVQARDVGIKTILVPRTASVLSALGGLLSDFKVSKIQSFVARSGAIDLDKLNEVYSAMYEEAESLLRSAGSDGDVHLYRSMDIHYVGQVQEVIVPLRSRTRRITPVNLARTLRDFHDQHEILYAFKRPDQPVEVVSARLELVVHRDHLEIPSEPFSGENSEHAIVTRRPIYVDRVGFVEAPIYDGTLLKPGNLVTGPAVIHEPDTTIVIYDRQEAMLDQHQMYVIEVVD
ncbi:MAG: hydantoinase/oxoprolinase family protein [Steroidobacteraceae bacterium]